LTHRPVCSVPCPHYLFDPLLDHSATHPDTLSLTQIDMVEFIPPPDPLSLLPPFLACLPTAFASPRPPPALLPLLAPILRQRVQYMTANAPSSQDSWLPLLSWNPEKGQKLAGAIESASFEPHPVSGEIESPEVGEIKYKRLDEETLKAHLPLSDLNLSVIYLWCGPDEEGTGAGWRVTELLPSESSIEDTGNWANTVSEANEDARQSHFADALRDAENEQEEDDDDYWAQYDSTPGGRTPAFKQSPAPQSMRANGQDSTSDTAYYEQYRRVQPAMDNDDPSERTEDMGESTLNGDMIANIIRRQTQSGDDARPPPYASSGFNHEGDSDDQIINPRPSPPGSRGSDTVARLEETAESQSTAEIGVKQHISTNIKSLYRLAKSTGMDRTEFERIVQRELEVLSIGEEN
jgi:hypothetical protein